jgi:hypothetical protein
VHDCLQRLIGRALIEAKEGGVRYVAVIMCIGGVSPAGLFAVVP